MPRRSERKEAEEESKVILMGEEIAEGGSRHYHGGGVWGVFLIFSGSLLLLNSLGTLPWEMAALGKCLGGDPQMSQARLIVGLIIILLGVNILFDLSLVKILFSLFVIWLGVRVLTGNQGKWRIETKTQMHEDVLKRVILFSKFNARL